MPLDPVRTLVRLIGVPSVNPMGASQWDATMGEARLTDLLVDLCREQGWRWTRRRVHPERDNLLILVEGEVKAHDGGELLLWDVHQDTVAAEGMSVDPFGGEVRDGKVFGRGACDVKGSMAAMLAGLSRAGEDSSQEGTGKPRPNILVACTVNEECGFTGARALAKTWGGNVLEGGVLEGSDFVAGELAVETLVPRVPDAAIVAEPTDLNVVVAHQGVIRWRCHAWGLAAHASQPDKGSNAIYAMSRVVQAIEAYHRNLASTAREHPLCGRASVCVCRIHGGTGVNTVPDHAVIEIDRRVSPGESPESAYGSLVDFIARSAETAAVRITHDEPFMVSPGLNDEGNRPLGERLARLTRKFEPESALVGVSYGTDAAAIATAGVPTVVFGPGSIEQAHTADEFIEIDELERATEIFHRIACEGLR